MSDYNSSPKNMKEISLKEFADGINTWSIKSRESRQVREKDLVCDMSLFDLNYNTPEKMGYALMTDWHDTKTHKNRKEYIYKFIRYGSEKAWETFINKVAAQFQGDNS